jgi:choline dehydrogenase-like flavoprotein
MIRNGEDLAPGTNLHADVCIVGAGAAGITLAIEIARQAPFISVLVLEGGTDPTRNGSPPPRETSQSQFLYRGELEGDLRTIRPQFLTQTRSRSYGGSTNCWGGWCRPLDAIDFKGHDDYTGWPITRGDLVPFYERAQDICFLDRFEYDDPQYWVDRARRAGTQLGTIPTAHGAEMRSVVIQAIRETRWSFFQDYHEELNASPNVTVAVNANLVEIVAEAAEPGSRTDRVRMLRLSSLDLASCRPGGECRPGVPFTATAERYVLALGGIDTVRSLLAATTPNQRHGLGNNTEHLGRFFSVHPVVEKAARVTFGSSPWPKPVRDFYAMSTDFYPERVGMQREVPSYEGHAVNDVRFAAPPADETPFTRVWATLTPTPEALASAGVGNFRVILRGDQQRADVDVNWEQVPDLANRVELTGERDVFGVPKVVLKWHIHERDEDTYRAALKMAETTLRNAGYLDGGGSFHPVFDIGDRDSWRVNLPNPGDHHLGGTRMSADPDAGVVDANALIHGMTNLYVSSCSMWPSGGWANPTLTIVAMASRLAHHLIGLAGAAGTLRTDEVTLPAPAPASGEAA